MRPGEVFALRWENIYLNGTGGLIQVTDGKTKAARRMLPMVPAVFAALKAKWEANGEPEEGWLFPSSSREGHLNKDTAKDQHKRALDRANAKAKAQGAKEIKIFQPYVLRHTALTRLAEAGCDVFTLARIAGHSSIAITQRYVHRAGQTRLSERLPADKHGGIARACAARLQLKLTQFSLNHGGWDHVVDRRTGVRQVNYHGEVPRIGHV